MTTTAALERYEAVIGIEVHSQLRTASKMFCGCSTAYDGAPPNTHVCPVCLGLPGALPTINRRAVEHVLATGAAIEATAPPATRWDRKNYFYPDLPKGYQISQYDLPLASLGRLTFDTSDGPFTVAITRAHLEEDTAKLVHATDADGRKTSLVDFNRSGAPLMEIVTEPDIRTAEQARRYAEELQLLLRSIGASDADMERGQMRVEANVSLRPRGTEPFGTRVEVKNMNSFRAVERAIAFEIERQAAALDAGEPLLQETRGWSEERGETYRMRVKETSDDYRYFPEPDLPPLHLDAGLAGHDPGRAAGAARRAPDPLPRRPRAERRTTRRSSSPTRTQRRCSRRPWRPFPRSKPKPVANWVTGEYLRLRNAASGPVDGRSPAELGGDRRGRRVGVDLAGAGSRGPRGARDVRRGRGVDHRRPGFPPDLGQRVGRGGRRRGPGGEPGRRRGLPRRQGAGRRLPRRAGHEGDPRPGQRGAGPGGRPRTPRRGSIRGGLNGWGR